MGDGAEETDPARSAGHHRLLLGARCPGTAEGPRGKTGHLQGTCSFFSLLMYRALIQSIVVHGLRLLKALPERPTTSIVLSV